MNPRSLLPYLFLLGLGSPLVAEAPALGPSFALTRGQLGAEAVTTAQVGWQFPLGSVRLEAGYTKPQTATLLTTAGVSFDSSSPAGFRTSQGLALGAAFDPHRLRAEPTLWLEATTGLETVLTRRTAFLIAFSTSLPLGSGAVTFQPGVRSYVAVKSYF